MGPFDVRSLICSLNETFRRPPARSPQCPWHLPDEAPELSIGVGARPIEVHVGGCYAARKRRRAVTREQALASLADGIRACIHCRPDTELGVLRTTRPQRLTIGVSERGSPYSIKT
ncbi:DUF6233 domain-containing protein [Streptomyces sp. NPDC002206]